MGLDPVLVSKYINGALGLFCIWTFSQLMGKIKIHSLLHKWLPFCIAFLMISFCFYELCADQLNLFMLSLYFNLIFSDGFVKSNRKLLAAGVLGALAFFAKAYNFYFFGAHIIGVLLIANKRESARFISPVLFKRLVIACSGFVILTGPYIFSLSKKYKEITVNTAGKLNNSWFLAPGVTDTQRLVIPPPYPGGVSNWDDPSYQQKLRITPFTSQQYFYKEIKLAAYNSYTLCNILTGISIFSIPCLLIFLFYLFKNHKTEAFTSHWILCLSTLLYPAGYLLIFIEWRYIWIIPLFLLMMGAKMLSYYHEKQVLNQRVFLVLSALFLISFTGKPIQELKDAFNNGKFEYECSRRILQNNIKGNILTKITSSRHQASISVICYLARLKFMGAYKMAFSPEELEQASRQYSIQYMIQLYDTDAGKKECMIAMPAGSTVKIDDPLFPGLLVFQLY
jgi:hypothetical protein